MRVECGITTCRFNKLYDKKYGDCQHPQGIVLKFRMAFDAGKGTIVMVECLNMEIEPDAA